MAKKVNVTIVDDIDGTEGASTVSFSLARNAYEIDLSDANRAKLEEALAPYIEKASKVRGSRKSRSQSDASTSLVRTWAIENGHEISDRGRIPARVLEAYEREN